MSKSVRQNRRPRGGRSEVKLSQIPTVQTDQVETLIIRLYNNESNSVKDLTFELPVPPFGYSTSTTQLVLPFKAVRLAKFECWCNYNPGVGVASNTLNVSVLDRRTARPIEWSDTATFLKPAHIKKKFSKDEPLGFWYPTSVGETNPEFTFQVPSEGIVQLTLNYILSDSGSVPTYATTGLTAGRIYTNSVDPNGKFSPAGKAYATRMVL